MQIANLRINNFRCLKSAELEFAAGLNAVVGGNGSGKTSLIEAIYFLARADSFRPGRRERLIRDGHGRTELFAQIRPTAGPLQPLGMVYSKQPEQTQIRHDGRDLKVHELVRLLPVLFVDPVLHQLLEEGPQQRRRFLDWGVFHVEHAFFDTWRRYRRALQQRNLALRSGADTASIQAWEPELCSSADHIDELRQRQVERLQRELPAQLPAHLRHVDMHYRRGWSTQTTLAEALASGRDRDRESGYTHRGPHRADLRIEIEGVSVAERASRGEQKLITIAMHMAQASTLLEAGHQPLLLIDDLAAELGAEYQNWLEQRLRAIGCQAMLSFLDQQRVPADARMFHVEHGCLKRVE